MLVEDVMEPSDDGCCPSDLSLRSAAREMERRRCDSLTVVDDQGRFLGIATRFDVDAKLLRGRRFSGTHRIADVVRRAGPVRAEDPLDVPLRLMAELGVSNVPVIDPDGSVRGTVSHHRISRSLASG